LKEFGIESTEVHILLAAFKEEGKIECYVKNRTDKSYKLFRTYEICSKSGILGPKNKQGDKQSQKEILNAKIERLNFLIAEIEPWKDEAPEGKPSNQSILDNHIAERDTYAQLLSQLG